MGSQMENLPPNQNSVSDDDASLHALHDNQTIVCDEAGAEERLARSRERNREHARRTRLRKKAQLNFLQERARELQTENNLLKQSVEECSIANILLGLASNKNADAFPQLTLASENKPISPITFGKRKRIVSDADSDSTARKAAMASIPGLSNKTHINWKTGAYSDADGNQKQLNPSELENLRRERNRMHAKMTRDRKKVFIASVDQTIASLEADNHRMRDVISKCAASSPTLAASFPFPKSLSSKKPDVSSTFSVSNGPGSVTTQNIPSSEPAKEQYCLPSGALSSVLDNTKFSLTTSALASHDEKSSVISFDDASDLEKSFSLTSVNIST